MLQEVLEAEMTDALGAAKGERSAGRLVRTFVPSLSLTVLETVPIYGA